MNDTPKKKRIEESEQVVDEKYEYITKPPDRGYGWIIAIAAMFCNFVSVGTLFTFGKMKIHIQHYFGCSDMAILFAISAPCVIYLLVGPIVSVLAKRYSFRRTIIIGSIGSAACTFISIMSINIMQFMIVRGIFGTVFFGMIYLSSVVVVSFYFDKKRAIVNGLVLAGGSIAGLIFEPLSECLTDRFDWKNGFVVLAVIILTCILFGAIMKPLKSQLVAIQRMNIMIIQSDRTTSSSTDSSNVPSSFSNDAMNTNNQINVPDVSNMPQLTNEVKRKESANRLCVDIKAAMRNFSVLKNRQMLLIYIGNIFSAIGCHLAIVHLYTFVFDGYEFNIRDASQLKRVFVCFHTLGLLSGGFITMIPYFSVLHVHNAFLLIAGMATFLAAYANNFITGALYAGLFGFAIAPHTSLLLSLICDRAGLDRYITGVSVLFVVRGVSELIGVYVIGYLKSYANNLKLAYLIGGIMIIFSAFIHTCLSSVEHERLQEKKVVEEETKNIDV